MRIFIHYIFLMFILISEALWVVTPGAYPRRRKYAANNLLKRLLCHRREQKIDTVLRPFEHKTENSRRRRVESTSRDPGAATASLGTLCQGLPTLTGKDFCHTSNLNFPSCILNFIGVLAQRNQRASC
uniref:Uncharacterized protein n=1 Tax=Corvus moneduloides TaxID=1196302 RepID=A0A8C3GXR8_CORMO